jgi:hypothetical protein
MEVQRQRIHCMYLHAVDNKQAPEISIRHTCGPWNLVILAALAPARAPIPHLLSADHHRPTQRNGGRLPVAAPGRTSTAPPEALIYGGVCLGQSSSSSPPSRERPAAGNFGRGLVSGAITSVLLAGIYVDGNEGHKSSNPQPPK